MTLLYTKNLNTEIQITDIKSRTYPEYSGVTCKLVRAGTDTPIPLKNIDFYVQGENTSKGEGEQYELLRTETTDKNGEVTFNVYLGSRYSGTFYQPRIKNYELQEHISQLPADYKTSGYSSVNYNPYGTQLFDIHPGMTIPFRLKFDAGKSENATLDEYSSNITYNLQSSSNEGTVEWKNDDKTNLKFVRMVRTNIANASVEMEANITHNLYVLYTDKNGVGIPNATLKCSINSGASLSGREFTKINDTSGTVVTNDEGLAYISLNGKTGNTSTTLTITSNMSDSVKNNLYGSDKTVTLNINWINRNTTYLTFTSISLFNTGSGMNISGTLHSNSSVNNQTISVKPYTIDSNGTLVSAGSATSITTSSDGSFSYTHDTAISSKYTGTPLVYSLQVAGVTRYVVTHFFNRDILRWNPNRPLTSSQLLEGVPVMSDWYGQILLADGNNTPIQGATVNVEISHTRKSQETNGDTEKSKVYKIYTTTEPTNKNGFTTIPFKDIQYAGTYVFKLSTNSRDGNLGVRTYKTQVKFTPIKTKLVNTNSVDEAPILSNGISIGRRLRDANDEPIGAGYITRTLTPKSQLTGITHLDDKTGVNIPANKTYTYPAVLTGSLGGCAVPFIAWSQPTTAKVHIAYDPAAYSDIYQPVEEDVTVTWKKATPTLTSNASTNNPKPLRATLKGEVITTYEAPVPPTYTNISTSNAKSQLGSTYVERNPDVTFIQVNEENYSNNELNLNKKPVPNIPIKSQITWNKTGVTAEYTNTGLTTQTTNTNNQGKITTSATPTNKAVEGTFKFTSQETTLYSEATSNTTLQWDYATTEIQVGSFTGYAQLLNPQSVTATLYNNSDPNNKKPISNVKVEAIIDFDDNQIINGKNSFSSELTTNSSGRVEYSFTPETREVTYNGVTPRVYGAVTFTYKGNELYKATSSQETTYWEQITPLYAEDINALLSDQPALWQCKAGTIVTYARENIVTHTIDYPILSGLDVEVTLSAHPGKNNTSTESLIQITGREANTDNTVEGQRYFTLTPQVTDKNGKVKAGFVSLSHGDITGVFQFRNTSNTIFLENYIRIQVYWKKRDMTLKVIQVYIDNKDKIDDQPVTSTTPVYLGSTRKVKLQLVDSLSYEDGRTVKITGVTVHKTVKWKTDNNTYLTYGQVRYQDDDGNSLDSSNPKSSWTSISNNSVSDDDGNTTVNAMVDRKSGVHIEYILSIQNDNLYNNVEQTVETWSEDTGNKNPPYISYWKKIPTRFTLVSSTQTSNGVNGELPLETTLPGSVQVRLNEDTSKTHRTDDYLGRLTGVKVTPTITWTHKNGETLTKTVTGTNTTSNNGNTDSNREIKHTYTPTNIGDIKGTFTFTFNGNELYEETTSTGYEVIWNKIKTRITAVDNVEVYNTRQTNILTWNTRPNQHIIQTPRDDWTNPSPGTNEKYAPFYAVVSTMETNTSYKHPNTGKIRYYYKDSKGEKQAIDHTNITGETFFITEVNSDGISMMRWPYKYEDSSFKNGLVELKFVAVYEETDLFRQSSLDDNGAIMNYTVHARVPTKINISHEQNPEHNKVRYNIPFKFTVILTDKDGIGLNGQALDVYWNNKKHWPEYNLDNWSNPNKIKRTGTVKGKDGVITKGNNLPDENGKYGKDVRADFECEDTPCGTYPCNIPLVVSFDPEDLIDKYLPINEKHEVDVDKDSPKLIYSNLPQKFRTNCDHKEYKVTVNMYNSIDEPITTEESITWKENIGDNFGDTDDVHNWDLNDYGASKTTLNNGQTSSVFASRSGVKLIRASFYETCKYYYATKVSYLWWYLYVEYGHEKLNSVTNKSSSKIEVTGGLATQDADCQLPVGLYDLQIDYIGPIKDDCRLYSDVTKYYGVHRKKGTEFILDTNNSTYNKNKGLLEQEIYKQFTAKTTLQNEDLLKLDDSLVHTDVNEENMLTQRTDKEASVTRHHMDEEVDHSNFFHFEYPQTRKQAPNITSFEGVTVPLTPIFAIVDPDGYEYYEILEEDGTTKYYKRLKGKDGSDNETQISKTVYDEKTTIINYDYVNFPMEIRVFYYRRKYDDNGEEVKQSSEGDVYHSYDDEGNDIYYFLKGRKKTEATRKDYTGASSYRQFYKLNDVILTWRASSGSNLTYPSDNPKNVKNVVATTDHDGYARVTEYHKRTVSVTNIRVHVEGYEDYNPEAHLLLKLDTRSRPETVLTDGTTSCVYNEPVTLTATLKVKEDGTILHGNTLNFYLDNNLLSEGGVLTDSKGVASVEYVPTFNPKDRKTVSYNVQYGGEDIYKSYGIDFSMQYHKQTPRLRAIVNKTNISYGDNITITGRLMESAKSIVSKDANNNGISDQTLTVYLAPVSSTPPTSTTDLTVLGDITTTSPLGRGNLDAQINKSGTFYLWCEYRGNDKFEKQGCYVTDNNGNIVSVVINSQGVSLTEEFNLPFESFSYNGSSTVKLTDNSNEQNILPYKDITVSGVNESKTKSFNKLKLQTNSAGTVSVVFTNTDKNSTKSKYYFNIGNANVGEVYYITYSFNNDGDTQYNQYGSDSLVSEIIFNPADTTFDSPTIKDSGDFSIRLVCKNNDSVLSNQQVNFYNGTKLLGSSTTNSKGIATISHDKLSEGIKITSKFIPKDSKYFETSSVDDYSYGVVEECNDLSTFYDTSEKVYYMITHGSPMYGGANFLRNMNRSVPTVNKALKLFTDELASKGVYYSGKTGEESEECVASRAGRVLRTKKILTTTNCKVTFEIKLVDNVDPKVFLGHFGLWSGLGSVEEAEARFENYIYPNGSNGYFIQWGNYRVRDFKPLELNKWYDVTFTFKGRGDGKSNCSCTFDGRTYSLKDPVPTGLAPYVFVATKDTEMRIKKITYIKTD